MTLFVYGGLLKGMTLSPFIESARYLGPGYIKAKIYFLGQFPGIVQGNDVVFGELYELKLDDLPGLDKIEDYHPENLEKSSYIRKKTEVNILPFGDKLIAEAYFYNRPIEDEHIYIPHGDYRRFIMEEENNSCWLIKNVVGAEKNRTIKEFSQSPSKKGYLQLIDIEKSNGSFVLKKENVQLIKIEKNKLNQLNEIKQAHKNYLSFSVPFIDEEGKFDVAFALFNSSIE